MQRYVAKNAEKLCYVSNAKICYVPHMNQPIILSFEVRCSACYGSEMWRHGKIIRLLTAAGKWTESSDIEHVAKQFIENHKHIACTSCNRINVLSVKRVA